ncbi:MAG: hypothetical protein WAT34_07460 [Chitinophagaceae bacterium]
MGSANEYRQGFYVINKLRDAHRVKTSYQNKTVAPIFARIVPL